MVLRREFKVYEQQAVDDGEDLAKFQRTVYLEHTQSGRAIRFRSSDYSLIDQEEFEEARYGCKKMYVPCYGALGVLNFGKAKVLVLVTAVREAGTLLDAEIFRVIETEFVAINAAAFNMLDTEGGYEDVGDGAKKLAQVKKFCDEGFFYFSPSCDITCKVQDTQRGKARGGLADVYDRKYIWNRELQTGLEELMFPDAEMQWLVHCIRGFVQFRTVYMGQDKVKVGLISRQSCERAGTRFNIRGIDDDGNVANEVETEQIVVKGHQVASFVQTRGSAPIFWEQPGFQIGTHKVKITRSTDATAAATRRHFLSMIEQYGPVMCLNLLSDKEKEKYEGERSISRAFEEHVHILKNEMKVQMQSFDFHQYCKGGKFENLSILEERISPFIDEMGYFVGDTESAEKEQCGVLRTNCLDCLDRTNVTQMHFGRAMVEQCLEGLGIDRRHFSKVNDMMRDLWADNGDNLSKIYAGTGAMKSSFTRTGKRTIKGYLDDAKKSAQRTYQNNFKDNVKQDAIDIFLENTSESRNADRTSSLVQRLKLREDEYITHEKINIRCATWNVNGGKNFGKDDLSEWLAFNLNAGEFYDSDNDGLVDMVIVGFQEIVDLTAKNIKDSNHQDSYHRNQWEAVLKQCLTENLPGEFALVCKEQLVGVCLFVFVRKDVLDKVRNVVIKTFKCGAGGFAGNKGAVTIRFKFNDTSMCFVCAHLAAGQSNVKERNSNYWEITKGVDFKKGRVIEGHDVIVWLGDFNYRIDLPNEVVRPAVSEGNFFVLSQQDQLVNEKRSGNCFSGYLEGPLLFPPTYKYDSNSANYDSSEKYRIPAWCDRILWKGRGCDMIYYNAVDLRSSDHRPVVAAFVVDTVIIDTQKEKALQQELSGSSMFSRRSDEYSRTSNEYGSQLEGRSPSYSRRSSNSSSDTYALSRSISGSNKPKPPIPCRPSSDSIGSFSGSNKSETENYRNSYSNPPPIPKRPPGISRTPSAPSHIQSPPAVPKRPPAIPKRPPTRPEGLSMSPGGSPKVPPRGGAVSPLAQNEGSGPVSPVPPPRPASSASLVLPRSSTAPQQQPIGNSGTLTQKRNPPPPSYNKRSPVPGASPEPERGGNIVFNSEQFKLDPSIRRERPKRATPVSSSPGSAILSPTSFGGSDGRGSPASSYGGSSVVSPRSQVEFTTTTYTENTSQLVSLNDVPGNNSLIDISDTDSDTTPAVSAYMTSSANGSPLIPKRGPPPPVTKKRF
eukprot:Nk52_evm41s745 gene=Nk52_evmTU41s745